MNAGLCVFSVTVCLAKLVWMSLVLLVIIYCFVYVIYIHALLLLYDLLCVHVCILWSILC